MGGFAYGALGPTHHGLEDLSVLAAMPGIDVLAPADPVEARLATVSMLRRPGPTYLRLGKAGEANVHNESPSFDRGRMIRVRDGSDALIITTGGLLAEALTAAAQWSRSGREAAVWSCPWLRPFDSVAVAEAATEFPVVLTAEEATLSGGLAASVAVALGGVAGSRAKLKVAGVPTEIGPSTISQQAARAQFGLDAAGPLARLSVV